MKVQIDAIILSMNTTTTLHVQGMTCGHCERAVTQAVRRIDPQAQVTIHRAEQQVQITNPSVSLPSLVAAIEQEGYHVKV